MQIHLKQRQRHYAHLALVLRCPSLSLPLGGSGCVRSVILLWLIAKVTLLEVLFISDFPDYRKVAEMLISDCLSWPASRCSC